MWSLYFEVKQGISKENWTLGRQIKSWKWFTWKLILMYSVQPDKATEMFYLNDLLTQCVYIKQMFQKSQQCTKWKIIMYIKFKGRKTLKVIYDFIKVNNTELFLQFNITNFTCNDNNTFHEHLKLLNLLYSTLVHSLNSVKFYVKKII